MKQTDPPAGAADVVEIDELQLIKIDDLADLWDVSKRTIELLIRQGHLKSKRIAGARRVRRLDALAYLESEEATIPAATDRRFHHASNYANA